MGNDKDNDEKRLYPVAILEMGEKRGKFSVNQKKIIHLPQMNI